MAAKKKTAKKTTKRSAKKTATAKKVTKKVTKKTKATRKAAKKTAKKTTAKKTGAKKTTQKAGKKAAKKAAKKVVKKARKTTAKKAVTPKKAATTKKTVKKTAKAAKKSPASKKATAGKPVKLVGFAKKQYQRLLDLRDGIVDAMNGITHDTLKNTDGMETGGGGMHTGDAGSDSYDRDFALNMLAKEQDSLSEIEQAIARAERGVYGICEMSGEKIPRERLEAIPFARYTVACQAEWEKSNNNGRHHNGKSEFGFSNGAMR